VVRVLVFWIAVLGLAMPLRAQDQEEFVDPFQQALSDMFELVEQPYVPYAVSEEPPPPGVPLDGGLVALIAAGGIAGYRRLCARQTHTV
jgi:MYXO-CTERM domain-containing protein